MTRNDIKTAIVVILGVVAFVFAFVLTPVNQLGNIINRGGLQLLFDVFFNVFTIVFSLMYSASFLISTKHIKEQKKTLDCS